MSNEETTADCVRPFGDGNMLQALPTPGSQLGYEFALRLGTMFE